MELLYILLFIVGGIGIILLFKIIIKILYIIFYFLPIKGINYFIIRYIKANSIQKKFENIGKEAAEIKILHFFRNSQFTLGIFLAIIYSFLLTSALELFIFHEGFIIIFMYIFFLFFLIFFYGRHRYNFSDNSDMQDIVIEGFSYIDIGDLLGDIFSGIDIS